jgi:hypothetical protein
MAPFQPLFLMTFEQHAGGDQAKDDEEDALTFHDRVPPPRSRRCRRTPPIVLRGLDWRRMIARGCHRRRAAHLAAVALAAVVIGRAGIAGADYIQFSEANRVLGWSADGTLALLVTVLPDGRIDHAELHPTRNEGWIYLITAARGEIAVRKAAVDRCPDWYHADTIARVPGRLTEAKLLSLDVIKRMKLVRVPRVDGGAATLTARFEPQKRFAEHQLVVRDGKSVAATLPVPVWCVGSSNRDEAWSEWDATVLTVATAGKRQLYVVSMKGVCDGGDKDLVMARVIATPGSEPEPRFSRCRGSGGGERITGWAPGWRLRSGGIPPNP